MSLNSNKRRICSIVISMLLMFCLVFSTKNTLIVHADNLSDPDTTAVTPIDESPYWPAIKQQIEGYTDDVYIPEDAARTLWNGTVGNGWNTPTVSGTVNGVSFTAGTPIPPTTFNALYYYLNYKDVRDALGANPQALVDNWVAFGATTTPARNVTSLIIRDGYRDSTLTEYGSSNIEYVVPSYQKTSNQQDGMIVIPNQVHSNGGMNRKQEIQARSVASQIADHVFRQVVNRGGGTEIEMVSYATGIIRAYCDRGTYTTTGTYYRTAYGVFFAGQYSTAGATRALGLVIDYLDVMCQNANAAALAADPTTENLYGPLKWVHVNANQWANQYCQLVCDYHEAYADPVASWAGYGKHPDEGGLAQDIQTYVALAYESDIITTKAPLVDGGSPVSYNAPDKNRNIQKNNNTY